MISALGSYGGTARPWPTLHTSSPAPPYPHPTTPTRPDAVQARHGFEAPLPAARTGRGELGHSWMLVPSLLGLSVRAGPWSPAFRDQNKGEPPRLGWPGGSLQGRLQTHTPLLVPGRIWGISLETPRVVPSRPTPGVLGRDFPDATKGPKGGPGAGRRAAEGAGGPLLTAGNGFPGGLPLQGLPARQPGTHRAGSGNPGPRPCPTGVAAGGGRRGTHVRGTAPGPRVRAERSGRSIWGGVTSLGSLLWVASQGAPRWTPDSHPQLLQPRHPIYRVPRDSQGKSSHPCCPPPFGRAPWESWALSVGDTPESLRE